MTDFGIFQILHHRLQLVHPNISIFGQSIPNMTPPYGILQLGTFEKRLIPQKTACQKITLDFVSRFKGEAEIQHLEQHTRQSLEGMTLTLEKNASGLIVWDESGLSLEKDNITRMAHLKFTVRLKL